MQFQQSYQPFKLEDQDQQLARVLSPYSNTVSSKPYEFKSENFIVSDEHLQLSQPQQISHYDSSNPKIEAVLDRILLPEVGNSPSIAQPPKLSSFQIHDLDLLSELEPLMKEDVPSLSPEKLSPVDLDNFGNLTSLDFWRQQNPATRLQQRPHLNEYTSDVTLDPVFQQLT